MASYRYCTQDPSQCPETWQEAATERAVSMRSKPSRYVVPRRGVPPSNDAEVPQGIEMYSDTFKEPSVISFHRRDDLLSQPDPPIFVGKFQAYRGLVFYHYKDANTGEPYYYSGAWESTHN